MINIIVKVPTGFTVAMPQADKNGKSTATPLQQEISNAVNAIYSEWVSVGHTATHDLYVVITQASKVIDIQALITKYKLPITVMHAQESFADTTTDKKGKVISTTKVYQQGVKKDLLPFMADIQTYDAKGKVISTKKALIVQLPCFSGHAAWAV